MNLFNTMTSIASLCGPKATTGLNSVWALVGTVFQLLLIGIPVILVLFGLMDLAKAVMAGKDDEIKNAQKMLIKRIIYTVLAFLLVIIIKTVLGLLADATGAGAVATCLDTIFNGNSTVVAS